MDELFLSRFTPSQMSHETLERIFVQREEFLARRLEQLREGLLTPARRYVLLIGPRGIGKTHLVSLVYHRIKEMDDLRERACLAWLREEEWGATNFLTFLIRVLRAVAREYVDASLEGRIRALFDHDPRTAERLARDLVLEALNGRVLLLLIENLDELFRQMGDEGQKRLRSFLQETASVTILATAQSLSDDIRLQTSPFYGFFTIYHLEELTLEEASFLLVRIAEAQGKPDLVEFIHSPEGQARLRALRHLAGGNHRVYVIFSQFLTRQSLDELTTPFLRMVDDLTPYFQDRMRVLSPQQRQIVELLCERRGALPVKEIARWCFITPQVAASQLKELREKAYVVSTPIGRESFYELREPLMRLTVETKTRGEGPIRLLVDFLRLWHTPTEIRKRLAECEAPLERPYLEHALRPIEDDLDPEIHALASEGPALAREGNHHAALRAAERLVALRGNGWDWCGQGICLAWLGRHEEALASYARAIELNPFYAKAWNNSGVSLTQMHRYEESLTPYDQTLTIDPLNSTAWYNRGHSLAKLGRHEDAIVAFDQAITRDPHYARAWNNRGNSLSHLERYVEAFDAYERAVALDPLYAIAWHNRGATLRDLGQIEGALASCLQAVDLRPDCFEYRLGVSHALISMGRFDDALGYLDQALEYALPKDEDDIGEAETILIPTLEQSTTPAEWRSLVTRLIDIYERHNVLSRLGLGTAFSIPAVFSSKLEPATIETWLQLWQELSTGKSELELPLRLLQAAIRWRENRDPRILLSLAPEERQVLEDLLPKDGDASSITTPT